MYHSKEPFRNFELWTLVGFTSLFLKTAVEYIYLYDRYWYSSRNDSIPQGLFQVNYLALAQDIDPNNLIPDNEHVACASFNGIRFTMLKTTGNSELVSEENFPWFKDFINGWHKVVNPAHFNIIISRWRRGPVSERQPVSGGHCGD